LKTEAKKKHISFAANNELNAPPFWNQNRQATEEITGEQMN